MTMPAPLRRLRSGPSQWESPIFRLAAVGLILAGILLDGQHLPHSLVVLSAVYLAISLVFWLSAAPVDLTGLVYAAVAVDAAYVTAALVLLPSVPAPLWLLYLLPITIGSSAGRGPGIEAAILSLAGLMLTAWLPSHALPLASIWDLAVLGVGLVAVIALSPAWVPELREKRFWPEVVSAARGLTGTADPDEVATQIVERARRLAGADAAWLWWCEADGRLRRGPVTGDSTAVSLIPEAVDEFTLERLGRGSIPLEEAVGVRPEGNAEVLALSHETGTALLAVGWLRRHGRRGAWRSRLHAFAPWAAEALARASAWEQQQLSLAREESLRQATSEWAATQNPVRAEEAAIRAVQSNLHASAAVLERASGRVLVGDSTVATVLSPESLEWLTGAPDRCSYHEGERDGEATALTTIRGGVAIAVSRAGWPFEDDEVDWLEDLGSSLAATLERCAAYATVEAEVDRLRAVAEAMPAPLALWDAGGRLLLANQAYSSLGMDSAPPVKLPLAKTEELEITAGTPARTFVLNVIPVLGGAYVLAHHREVTRERQALRAKDELIATVGHELKSPLTSIRGYSQMMVRQLRIVQSQVTQLDSLISDFVEASHREGSQLPLQRERVDLAEIARQASERFRGAHEGRELQLALSDGSEVEGDATRLGQVIDNLLSNAAKYSPDDKPIEMTVERRTEQVCLSVHDEGIGIAPEHLPFLFDRFYRAPGPTEAVKGLGLGLSIVRDLVVAHGGRVWAESEGISLGSTFSVSLPASATPEMRRLADELRPDLQRALPNDG